MTTALRIVHADHSETVSTEAVLESYRELLSREALRTMATGSENDSPHINNAFFAAVDDIDLTIWSSPTTQHSRNVIRDGNVAIAVFATRTNWGEDVHGVQIQGRMTLATGFSAAKAFRVYARKYAGLLQWAKAIEDVDRAFESRFFILQARGFRLIDEARFGKENYIVAERI